MGDFGFTSGAALGLPAIILWGLLAALILFGVLVGLARGRRDDPNDPG